MVANSDSDEERFEREVDAILYVCCGFLERSPSAFMRAIRQMGYDLIEK